MFSSDINKLNEMLRRSGRIYFVISAKPFREKKTFSKSSVCAYHSGIATLTVGSIFKGVLEIYGTTNQLIVVYWIAGFGLLFIGILTYLLSKKTGYSKIAD